VTDAVQFSETMSTNTRITYGDSTINSASHNSSGVISVTSTQTVSLVLGDDFERSFGGLRRLYGATGADRIFSTHAVVVGIGGVGSWVVEAFARSGVQRISLVDLDHVSVSNINRQLHATQATIGQSKVHAMRERIALINPACVVDEVEEFVDADNWQAIAETLGLTHSVSPVALVDACDQVRAKAAMAAWSLYHPCTFVTVGAAGGKHQAHLVEAGDLAQVTHDPLLAQLRYQLRKAHNAAKTGRMEVACVFSREPVLKPKLLDTTPAGEGADTESDKFISDGSLNCHGYGSSVAVTASFGMSAAGWCMQHIAQIK
jgi:tRNA A37 threonylcarbamoyladenosine dehydratase